MNIYQKLAMKLARYVGEINRGTKTVVEDSVISDAKAHQLNATEDSLCFSHLSYKQSIMNATYCVVQSPFNPKVQRNIQITQLFPLFPRDLAEQIYDIKTLYEFQHRQYSVPRDEQQLLCWLLHKYEPNLEAALIRQSRFNKSRTQQQEKQAAKIAAIIEHYSHYKAALPPKPVELSEEQRKLNQLLEINAELKTRLAREKRANEEIAAQKSLLTERMRKIQAEKARKLGQNDELETAYYRMRFGERK